jgi:membrane protein implicated in regulation of membrane protease activity
MSASMPRPPGSGTPTSNGVDPAAAGRASASGGVGEAKANTAAESTDESGAGPSSADEASAGASSGAANSSPHAAAGTPLDGLESQFSELLAYLAHYVAAQRDRVEWRLLAFSWRLVLLVGVGLAALSVMVTAAVFVMRGTAHGLASALGERLWAGELIVGLAVFIVVAIAQSVAFRLVRRRWRERTRTKYETYRERERAAFGHDVEGAAERRDN